METIDAKFCYNEETPRVISDIDGVVDPRRSHKSPTFPVGAIPELPLAVWQATKALRIDDGFWYVGSPYSRDPDGLYTARYEISLVAGALISAGVPSFSPISHSHGICMASGVDPYSGDIWIRQDHPIMAAAHGLIVVMVEGWETSRGMALEIEEFRVAGKSIVYVDPNIDGWLAGRSPWGGPSFC